ncbi:MAG: hypothetical protein K2G30_05480, partial [Muribaculaceae bacterium]|nr:hypothetical protein [Muribaculaceae bacterium]
GVVDRDGLENRCTLTGTQGSNPCLSAKKPQVNDLWLFPYGGGLRRVSRKAVRAHGKAVRRGMFAENG